MRVPNFDNMRRVLDRECPERPTLFEFFLNTPLYEKLAGPEICARKDDLRDQRIIIEAFKNAGYDYATIHPPADLNFPSNKINTDESSISLNEYSTINDRSSFEAYNWPEPDNLDYSIYDRLSVEMPSGMKMMVCGPCGVLENVIRLLGYDNLCFLTLDDPALCEDIFDAIGSRLLRHYELTAEFDAVGGLIYNDDWGFKTQTMLPPSDFQKYIFPWVEKIVSACHKAAKPVVLHSCGNLENIMDDIIDVMKFDGKHSYEDTILPVEEAYERWGRRIAIMGGIDLDFVCRRKPEEVRERSKRMIERSQDRGSYALGTGNSVPEYVPDDNYMAMISAI